jgi:ectoine hydroxylase-related dioxygenase (phytanoyl-CoA dioxygenase family)
MPLSPQQIEAYGTDGYLVIRGVFSPDEVAAMAREADGLLEREGLRARNNIRVRWTSHVETGEPLFELFDPVLDLAPTCRGLMLDARLTGPLSELVGDEVCLFKDKLIYKPSGATGYPLHQDYIAWPGFPESFTTAVVAIDAAGPTSGNVEVFPGAHRRGYLSERDGNFHMLDVSDLPAREPFAPELAPGDVLVIGAFMPHRSAPNRSAASRRHLLVSYNARREGGDQRREHYEAFHHYLRSVYGAMGLGDLVFE